MIPTEFDLAGKVALVTGAGRGICKGIAQVLAEAGADIALNALTPRYLLPSAAEIAAATGRRVVPIAGDMTRTGDVERVVQKALEEFGRIDILVNGPGDSIRAPLAPLPGKDGSALSDDELARVMDLNLTQALICTRAVASHMLGRRDGKIINISGFAAIRGGAAGRVIYATAKMGLIGFTRAQALEWAPYNVQVNAIAPGLFRDPGMPETEEQREGAGNAPMIPLGRRGTPRDAGLLALYLASAASDYMTGQTLFLEGGVTL